MQVWFILIKVIKERVLDINSNRNKYSLIKIKSNEGAAVFLSLVPQPEKVWESLQ